jgi:hypothetical protein
MRNDRYNFSISTLTVRTKDICNTVSGTTEFQVGDGGDFFRLGLGIDVEWTRGIRLAVLSDEVRYEHQDKVQVGRGDSGNEWVISFGVTVGPRQRDNRYQFLTGYGTFLDN